MADRFPSLEDFSAGREPNPCLLLGILTACCPGQTEARPTNGDADADDFLARERALLGEDANRFATPQDDVATAEKTDGGNDDLLGESDTAPIEPAAPAAEEVAGFESSFPALEPPQNEVRNGVYISG